MCHRAGPLRFAIPILLLLVIAACTRAAEPAAPPASTTPPAPPILRIYNWDTYIDPALLAQFEDETGARIAYSTFGSSEELLASVKAAPGAYDVVVPSDYMVEIMRREGLLAPLDKRAVPNLANLDPLFASPAFDPANRFCAPYLWGTMGIGYNSSAARRPITRWSDIFEGGVGRVALIDDPRAMLGIALLALGHSPNTTSPREIAAAGDFLIARASRWATIAPDTGQDLLADGSVEVAVEWSGDVLQVSAEHPEISYVIPADGSIIWTDSICVLQSSPNQALAQRFINFILLPTAGAALANYTRYSTPNREATAHIRPSDLANEALYPGDSTRRQLFSLVDVGPEATDLYAQTWARVLAAHPSR